MKGRSLTAARATGPLDIGQPLRYAPAGPRPVDSPTQASLQGSRDRMSQGGDGVSTEAGEQMHMGGGGEPSPALAIVALDKETAP